MWLSSMISLLKSMVQSILSLYSSDPPLPAEVSTSSSPSMLILGSSEQSQRLDTDGFDLFNPNDDLCGNFPSSLSEPTSPLLAEIMATAESQNLLVARWPAASPSQRYSFGGCWGGTLEEAFMKWEGQHAQHTHD